MVNGNGNGTHLLPSDDLLLKRGDVLGMMQAAAGRMTPDLLARITPILYPPAAPPEDGKVRLNLACGQRPKPGFVNADIVKSEGTDVATDLFTSPWPWADASVDEIEADHFVEHVPDLVAFLAECYRVLKVGGTCKLVAPYYTSVRCWQDPTHLRAISENTFLYFNKAWRDTNGLSHYAIHSDFDFTFGYGISDPSWVSRSEEARAFAVRHYFNVVDDLHVCLTKRAGS